MEKVIQYGFLSEFDKHEGTVVKNQYPLHDQRFPLVSDQIEDITYSLMPLNLHKYLDSESFTILKLKLHKGTQLLSYTAEKNPEEYEDCFLYTVSFFKSDDSFRGGTAKALSIITRCPVLHVFKPLLTFILHQSFDLKKENTDIILKGLYTELNKLPIMELLKNFYNFSSNENYLLSRVPSLNENMLLNLTSNIDDKSIVESLNKDIFKFKVMIDKIPFPIYIPLSSLIYSKFGLYGIDLGKDKILYNLIDMLNKVTVSLNGSTEIEWANFEHISPYKDNTPIIQILLLSLIQRQKLIVFGNNVCINEVMDTVLALSILMNSDKNYFPYIDLSQLDQVQNLEYFVFGTTNLLFKEKKFEKGQVMWDLFLDLDSMTLLINDPSSVSSGTAAAPDLANKRRSTGKLKNLFKRKSVSSVSSVGTSLSTTNELRTSISATRNLPSSTSNRNSLNSDDFTSEFENKLHLDNSIDKFSIVTSSNNEVINKYIISSDTPPTNRDSFFGIGFQYDDRLLQRAYNLSGKSVFNYAKLDDMFSNQLNILISFKHDDQTIYRLITNYLWNLNNSIYPIFEDLDNLNKLLEYQYFTQVKIDDEDGYYISSTINSELEKFIKKERIIQPMPFGLSFENNGSDDDGIIVVNHTNLIGYRILGDYYNKIFDNNFSLYKSYLKLTNTSRKQGTISLYGVNKTRTLFNVNDYVYHFDFNHALHCINILAQEGHGIGGLKFQDDYQQIVVNPYDVLIKLRYIGQIFKMINDVISDNEGFIEFICHCIRFDELSYDVNSGATTTKSSGSLIDTSLNTLENVLLTALFFTSENTLKRKENNSTDNENHPTFDEFSIFLNKFFRIMNDDNINNSNNDNESRDSELVWLIDWIDENLNDFIKSSVSDYVKYHI